MSSGARLASAWRRTSSGSDTRSALIDRDLFAHGRPDVDLPWAADLRLGRRHHLLPLGDPSRQPPDREAVGEHVLREADGAVDQARVEVDVGVEAATDEVLVVQRDLFEALGNLEQRLVGTGRGQDPVRRLLDDRRAGIEVLVDAVPEAREAERVVRVLRTVDPLLD